ncbi:Hypothetical protein PAQ_116 [Candidatus Portiera aleyrodidarum BT-QVLC]|nr:Hypothetical protein PAQ_116 [Candidatus Portiera aleyrodidarum BT-QVLC]
MLDLSFVFIIYENINKYSLLYYLLITQFFIIYASNYLFHILYFYFLQTITAFKNLHTLILILLYCFDFTCYQHLHILLLTTIFHFYTSSYCYFLPSPILYSTLSLFLPFLFISTPITLLPLFTFSLLFLPFTLFTFYNSF